MSCWCWFRLVGEVRRLRKVGEGVGPEWWENLELKILLRYYVESEYMRM
jgi:hypothetical protein